MRNMILWLPSEGKLACETRSYVFPSRGMHAERDPVASPRGEGTRNAILWLPLEGKLAREA